MTGSTAPVPDAWDEGDPYELYVGRWSREAARSFLSWLDAPRGERWLDIGCGTGALSAGILAVCAPASVIALEPSKGFLGKAAERLGAARDGGRARFLRGNATGLPLRDASVGTTVSGLVLNFVPAPQTALAEMARVTAAGGTIAAYVWDYAGRMDLMRHFWDAAVALDPGALALDEGVRFPLCRPPALIALFRAAGLGEVEAIAIDVPTPFRDFEDYWSPFLGGQGPAPSYVRSLGGQARERLKAVLRERVPAGADGAISLMARAWAVRGRKDSRGDH